MTSINTNAAICGSTPAATPNPPATSAIPRNTVNPFDIPMLFDRASGSFRWLYPLLTNTTPTMSRSSRIPISVKRDNTGNMRPPGSTQDSGFAFNLGPPPAHAHKKKSPVFEKLGRLALKRMPHELQNPSRHEQPQSPGPQPVKLESDQKHCNGDENRWDPQRVAQPVDRVLVASRITRNPLLASKSS